MHGTSTWPSHSERGSQLPCLQWALWRLWGLQGLQVVLALVLLSVA